MANQDDLSVNIGIGLEIDKTSFKEAKEELQFILELQKELGIEGVKKIRVGGYSTGNSPDKVSRNKAASQFEKMGGDFTGVDIADKAQAELAKQFNQASRELAKLFNIDFIPDAAAALGQIEFSMPDPEKIFNTSGTAKEYNDKIQKATEDLFMDAFGEVTVSPAFFLAAAEKVIKNNPDLYMPRGMKDVKSLSWMQTGGQISPTSVFSGKQPLEANPAQVATFDKIRNESVAKYGGEKMAAAFNYAVGKDLDEIVIGAWEKASKEVASNKDIKQILKDDPTFSISGIAASDAFANLEIYFMERFIENVKEGELAKGYQSSTFASHMESIESASRGGTLLEFPDDPMNVLPKDKIINWLKTMVEDGVMNPLMQVMQNPGILGKSFVSQSESTIKGGFTRLVNQSSGEATLSKKAQAEKQYHDQLMAQAEQLTNMAKWLDARVTGDLVKNMKILEDGVAQVYYPPKDQKPQARGGGPLNPDMDLLRKYLTEQKALAEKQGKVFQVGLDTEFNVATSEKVTELGMAAAEASGKIQEIFKFFQLPGDASKMLKGYMDLPAEVRAGQVGTPEGLFKRAAEAGVPRSMVGDNDPAANVLQYRQKMQKLVDILDLLAELGIKLTGNSFDTAEISNITKGIDYINEASKQMGLAELRQPNFGNFFDPVKNRLDYSADTAPKQLRDVYKNESGKPSASLNDVITRIANTEPAWFKKFESSFKMNEKGTAFEYTGMGAGGAKKNFGPHVAMADAAASAVISQYIKDFGGMLSVTLEKVTSKINEEASKASYSASGGGRPPVPPIDSSDKGMADFGDRSPDSIIKRIILTAKELQQPLETVFTTLDGLKSKFPILQKLTDAEMDKFQKRIELLQSDKSGEGHLQILTELALKEKELADARKEMTELSQGNMGFILQQRRSGMQGPLTEDQTAFKESGGVQRYDSLTESVINLRKETSKLTEAARQNEIQVALDVVETSRKGHVTEQLTDNLRKQVDAQIENTQAGKAATNSIKAQMQEQVNAQKAVQKQTQSLMNTWVTSRYALYDIGNFYTSVAQNLIRVSRQIFDTTQSYRTFESSFTSVERAMELTSKGAVDLRDQFIALSEKFPISFEEIARIATLGAQMGIAADGVVQFTETVSKFSSITGISADTVAQKFGKIAELADVDTSDFENLGSAVAFAGINAVATESEILTLSESIAAVANQSGITAPEIIGIATALASVGVPAEQARGVFTRVFADLDRVANTGGESLANFASVARMSSEEFASSWGTEGKSNDVFIALLEGINASNNLTRTFDRLNIVETREINTLTRLAKNIDVVKQALGDSNKSFEEGIFLGDSFEKTADNLDAKIIVFKNNVDALAAAFSTNMAESLKTILDIGSGLLKFLKGASGAFSFQFLAPGALIATTVGVAMAGLIGIMAKLTAQLYAFRVAMVNQANNPLVIDGIGRQVKALLGLNSGMIELRNQMTGAGVDARGMIEPINYTGLISSEKEQQAELLRTRDIYLANGEAMRGTQAAKEAGAVDGIHFARLEADAVQAAINGQIAAIKSQEAELDQLIITRKTATGATAELIDSEIAQKTAIIESSRTRQLYTTIHAGQVKIIDADTLATYRNTVATKAGTEAEIAEAQARSQSATAITLQTTAAAKTVGTIGFKIGSMVQRVVGIATFVLTAITAIDMLVNAIKGANEVDLAMSGGGIESLQEAIKKDTQAVKEGTMEAVTMVTVGYTKLSAGADEAAIAINKLTGTQSLATQTMSNTTEETEKQTLAIGENTKVWLANAIAKNENLKDIDFNEVRKSMDTLGMDFDTVLKQMVAAANGADINPLADVETRYREVLREISQIRPQRGRTQTRENVQRLEILEAEKKALEDLKKSLGAIEPAFEEVFGETTAYDAVLAALGVTTNSILDLSDALAEATKSGTGMDEVLLQVQAAVIEVAGITSEGDLLKIRTTSSIQALLDVVRVMYEAAAAAENLKGVTLTNLRQDRAMAARGTSEAAQAAVVALDNQIKNFAGTSSEATGDVEALREAMTSIESILAGAGGDGSRSGSGPEARIRTLTDYVNELRNVLQSAFDIRYQKQVGLDAITSSWLNLTKSAEDARDAVKSANDEINQSTAERSVLEYQLSVAERYGDEKRAVLIRAKLAKLDGQIIDQQQQLAEANENNNKTLVGNSQAAINNRGQVRDLVTQYNSYLVALANTGMSNSELQSQAQNLAQEFLAQGQALGFSREELDDYTDAFSGDFTTVINNLPRDITLDVNTDPAMRAITEFVAQAKAALSTVGVGSINSGYTAQTDAEYIAGRVSQIRANLTNPKLLDELKKRTGTTGGEYFIYMRAINNYLKNITREQADSALKLIGLSQGGFVNGPGSSTSDSIPAMLSKGEYVVRAKAVSSYGLDFMNALNQQRIGFQPSSQGMALNSSSSSSVVYLSPEDRALLRAAVDRPINLYTDNGKIASSANAGNVLLAQRGAR